MGLKDRVGNMRDIGIFSSRLQLQLQLQHPYKNQR